MLMKREPDGFGTNRTGYAIFPVLSGVLPFRPPCGKRKIPKNIYKPFYAYDSKY